MSSGLADKPPPTDREVPRTTKHSLSPAVRRLTALAGVLVALAVPASLASAAASSSHVVRVLRGKDVVAVFRSAKCRINGYGFLATATNRGYELLARVHPFRGFQDYALQRGHATGRYVVLSSPAHVTYASDYVPPYPVPGAGAINFADHGTLMGVGFSPMFSEDGSDAVTVAGVLTCHYPKKKRRRSAPGVKGLERAAAPGGWS
jgi:hypothetical protein